MQRPRISSSSWPAIAAVRRSADEAALHTIDEGWEQVFRALREMLGVQGGFAIFILRAGEAWLPRLMLQHGEGADQRERIQNAWLEQASVETDQLAKRSLRGAGRDHRAFLLSDLAFTREEHEGSPLIRLLGEHGVRDRLLGVRVVSTECELHLGFDRCGDEPAFTPKDREKLLAALETLGRAARWLALSHGVLPAGHLLTPREREVAAHLLEGSPEQAIARRLGLTDHSLHQLVVQLYRKLEVSSRPEFMALWL